MIKHILLIIFAAALFILFVSFLWLNTSMHQSQEAKLSREEVAGIRAMCFERIGQISEKDDTRFNEIRSLADYRLHKYRECLRENGVLVDE